MSIRDIKSEARQKLSLNIHQAIVVYTIEYVLFMTLVALIALACVAFNAINKIAAVVMIVYGVILLIVYIITVSTINFAMVDFYLASYKCKPYNIRRMGDVLSRSGLTKILGMNAKRVAFSFLLLLLLIVPGVIYIIRSSMANHLLIANPKMNSSSALGASNKVMAGKTGAYFSLGASFIGWFLLGIITLGIGFVFIIPYFSLCKTVYYKRNLQGDKAIYNMQIQPVSPVFVPDAAGTYAVPQAPSANVGQARRAETAGQEPSQPIYAEPSIPPIDTLAQDDVDEMNAAIRDLENAINDVPEVAIPPVSPQRRTTAQTSANDPIASVPDRKKPEITVSPLDGSDFVETVKPLTTQEVDAADVMGRRIGDLFNNVPTGNTDSRSYFGSDTAQSDDDFVTAEAESVADPTAIDATESIMSDSEFADFLKNFDIAETAGAEFKPLTRTPRSEAPEQNADASSEERKPDAARPALAREPSQRPAPAAGNRRTISREYSAADRESLEARIARLRKEREERMKNAKK